MISKFLKQYSEEMGMKVADKGMYGSVYGVVDGFMVTIKEGEGRKIVSYSCAVTDEIATIIAKKLESKEFKKQYSVVQYELARESVTVVFADALGATKKIRAALDTFPALLREWGVLGDGFCTACGNNIDPMQETNVVLINGIAHRIHSSCAQNLDMRAEIEKNDYEMEQKNIGKGILGALLGAALGGIVWGVVYYIGYFAAIVGVLIAFLAKKGYELLGGKVCKAKTVVILLATVFGVVLGQVGVYCVLFGMDLLSGGYSLMAIPYVFIETLKVDSEFATGFLTDLGAGLFFGILGAIGTALTAKNEHKNATIKTQILE